MKTIIQKIVDHILLTHPYDYYFGGSGSDEGSGLLGNSGSTGESGEFSNYVTDWWKPSCVFYCFDNNTINNHAKNTMKKNLLPLLLFVMLANVCFSQDKVVSSAHNHEFDSLMALVKPKYKWMGTSGRMVADDMRLKYRKPKGFREDGSTECFKNYPNLKETFSCQGPQLHSNDEMFISFLEFVPMYTKEFEKTVNQLFPQHTRELVDKQHRWQMRGRLKQYYGESICESWADSITVFSTEEACRKFNADSAFTFSLHLHPADYYKGNFKYMKALLIQKKGRGYACIYSFYTDKAKAKFDKYWRRIEKTLRYKD